MQEDRRMMATSTVLPDTGESRKAVELTGISDVPIWRHVLDPNPEYKRAGPRIVIYPDFLLRLGPVSTAGVLGMDTQEEPWPVYRAILNLMDTWQDDCRPIIVAESDTRLAQWDDPMDHVEEWMEEAKPIAVAGYRRVLENIRKCVLPKCSRIQRT
jgi:hypothetical protein